MLLNYVICFLPRHGHDGEGEKFNSEKGESEADVWLKSKIFTKSRKQLIMSYDHIRRKHKVLDKQTKQIIPSSWEAIMTAIVFDRDDIESKVYKGFI